MGSRSDRAGLRARAHELLRTELGVDVGRLCPQCASTAHGMPVVLDGDPRLRVSLSYAPGLVAVAWSTSGPVGIDVEPDAPLHPPVDGVPDVADWTRREALAKASGWGLAAASLSDLPVVALRGLPAGYVGSFAGRDVGWRVIGDG